MRERSMERAPSEGSSIGPGSRGGFMGGASQNPPPPPPEDYGRPNEPPRGQDWGGPGGNFGGYPQQQQFQPRPPPQQNFGGQNQGRGGYYY